MVSEGKARLWNLDENEEGGESGYVVLKSRKAELDPTIRGPIYGRWTAPRHLNLSRCR